MGEPPAFHYVTSWSLRGGMLWQPFVELQLHSGFASLDLANSRVGMKYFKLIRSGIDVLPLLDEIRSQEEAWARNTSRQDRIKVQRNTNTIYIRGAVPRPDLNINENQESQSTPMAKDFPKALEFMTQFASEMGCVLSRATIVRLKPKSEVFRHIDEGSYYFLRDRFHLVVKSSAGSVLLSGGEQVRMQEGELWWFDNKQFHESFNESDEWRIHFIFDLLPEAYHDLAVNPVLLPAPAKEPAQRRETEPEARQVLASAIRERGIIRGSERRIKSPKGNDLGWLINLRPLFLNARTLEAAAELFCRQCGDRMPFQVGAIESAAVPLLAAILMKAPARLGQAVNGFIIRKERKQHGEGTAIEGELSGDPIILVDDLFNSGSSLEKARVILENAGRKAALAWAVIDYRGAEGLAWQQRHGTSVLAPFTLDEFALSVSAPSSPLKTATFRNRWRFRAPDANFFHRVPKSFPATDGKRVFFGSDCGTFWCLNAHDGAVAWRFAINAAGHKNIWSSPALHEGRVYFGSYDGQVYCLDCESGEVVWRSAYADWVGSSPAIASDLGLLFVGLEFASGNRGSIAALRLDNGDKVWEHKTLRYTHASPAYSSELRAVACGSNDNEMFLFDAATGAVRWRFETSDEDGWKGSIRHAPAFDLTRGQLITGCANGRVYVIDAATGNEAWSVKTGGTIYTVPLVEGGTAWIGSADKHMYVLDLERRVVRTKIFTDSQVFGPPRLIEGRVYFGACNGIVYEIDPITDAVTGTHQLADAVTNAVAHNPANGDFYALTYMNELVAFQREAAP